MSSVQTESAAQSEAVISLGQKLANELGSEHSTDTLSRWMAFYISELILKTENATGKAKRLAEKQCFEAILHLWQHKNELPNGQRPFKDLEPVLQTIESLDPDNESFRYFRSARPLELAQEDEAETTSWLSIASGLDYSAKLLIGYCLSKAASSSLDKSQDWIKLAEAAGMENTAPEIAIRFISNNLNFNLEEDANAEVRRQAQNRLERLEGFLKLVELVANDLKSQLAALPPSEKNNDEAQKTD